MILHECVEGDREKLARSEGTVLECCGEEGASASVDPLFRPSPMVKSFGCPSQGGQAQMDLKDERCLG